MTGEVSQVDLGSTQMELRYADRFTVKLELNADFRYELQVLKAVREDQENKHGPQAAGTIDLTRRSIRRSMTRLPDRFGQKIVESLVGSMISS